ncbi:peroxisomal biogenesis factor 6 [Physcia stellaris]|nr:peroxisomal biogenesis factor 6 [Physcia stellaris]
MENSTSRERKKWWKRAFFAAKAFEEVPTPRVISGSIRSRISPETRFSGITSLDIQIIDVQPLTLDLVVVSVNGDALDKHEDVQARFGGGFQFSQINGSASKTKGKGKSTLNKDEKNPRAQESGSQEQRLTVAVKDALASLAIVHQDDLLSLPLPTHPITHVPLPPAKITLCEPVRQGLIAPSTRIVVNREGHAAEPGLIESATTTQNQTEHIITEEQDSVPNEHFYSATEDDIHDSLPAPLLESSTSDDESLEEADTGSDSSENVVSMTAPTLATVLSGMQSTRTAATPRANVHRPNGITTPGSVYSNYTAATTRKGIAAKSRLFALRALSSKIPDTFLHPKPPAEEDEEARIFVDIKLLLRLGCFSGDWIRVTTNHANNPDQWEVDAFRDADSPEEEFRPMKIYGLPCLTKKVATGNRKEYVSSRRSSHHNSPFAVRCPPEAWVSPYILTNLGNPQSVRLIPLSIVSRESITQSPKPITSRVLGAKFPPVAKELTLRSISTPLSTELTLQDGLMAAIKGHFQHKHRVLRQGDLLAVAVDVATSRLLAQASSAPDTTDSDGAQLLAVHDDNGANNKAGRGPAWYKVSQIVSGELDRDQCLEDQMTWGGVFSIEPGSTRMAEAGRETSKVPECAIGWEYYLGLKVNPKHPVSPNVVDKATSVLPRPRITPLRRRLRELIAASTSSRAVHLKMDPSVILLHSTQRNIGKAMTASRAASDIGNHVFIIDGYELVAAGAVGGGDIKTEAVFQARVERAMICGPTFTVVLIRHVEALTADRMVSAFKDAISQCRIVIATTTEIDKIPDAMRGLFTHEIEVPAPDEGEREDLLRDIINERGVSIGHDVDIAALAVKSAALVAGDLVDIVERAVVARQKRLESLLKTNKSSEHGNAAPLIRDILISGGPNIRSVTRSDFNSAVDAARKNFADAIGAPKIPNVGWDDVGGLTNVKDAVMETIQLPLERPELFAKGMKKRSGILFYGPPGTGKTLLAKAIATEFSLNFFSVKGPELLNMYIGESEANVRRVFQRARDARPCVVFFDELDSVAPKRGNQGDSGGVMDRIVSQLLAELDGMSDGDEGARGGVFVIGATNRPDLLDQALLRPGRFDKMLYLGVADTHDKQLTILEALTRKFTLDPRLNLRRVAESLPFTYTGADLYALASDAMLKAITRQADAVDGKIKALPDGPVTTAYFFDHLATEDDIAVTVTEVDFEAAKKELVGSVSAKELEHYSRVRAAFEGVEEKKGRAKRSSHSLIPEPVRGPMPTRSKDKKRLADTKPMGTIISADGSKGKSRHWGSSDEDDDEAYITSNDFQATPEKVSRGGPGSLRDEESMYE